MAVNLKPLTTPVHDLPGLADCYACTVRGPHVNLPVPGYGPRPNKIMFLAQAPGKDENARGIPLIGYTGTYLSNVMQRELNWDLNTVYRTNAIHCYPWADRKPDNKEVRTCTSLWLVQEVATVDPDIIVAMGDVAYRALMPDEKSTISNIAGSVFRRVVYGRERYIIPTLHPSAVSRNIVANEAAFVEALRKARALLDGEKLPAAIPFRRTEASWQEVLDVVRNADKYGFDLETDSAYRLANVCGIGVCAEPGNGVYYPVVNNIEARARMAELRPYLEGGATKVVSNVKFERHICMNYGITVQNYQDTLLKAWVLGDQPLGLKDGVHRQFGIEMIRIDKFNIPKYRLLTWRGKKYNIKGAAGKAFSMRQATIFDREGVVEYAAQDPDASLRLDGRYDEILATRPRVRELYDTLELPFVEIIIEMERNGMRYEAERVADFAPKVYEYYIQAEAQCGTLIGYPFNPKSVPQKQRALYFIDSPYKLPPPKRKKKSDPRKPYLPTGKVELAEYVGSNPLVRSILTATGVWKQYGYARGLPTYVEDDGKIHTDLKQNVAATGRLSSGDPNLQNIPARNRDDMDVDIEGATLRRAFVPDPSIPGCILMAPDLSQIEMRIQAHECQDETMLKLFQDDLDMHDNTARGIYKTSEAVVGERKWKEMRYLAKTIGFGVLYGLTPNGLLARTPTLKLTLDEATDFINAFYSTYPRLRPWQEMIKVNCRKNGFAETILGRRRYIPDITSTDNARRAEAERQAINVPIQGSAADYFKLCILAVAAFLREHNTTTRLINQVHDEIVMEGPVAELPLLESNIPQIMSNVYPLRVPVKVDMEWGDSWGSLNSTKKWIAGFAKMFNVEGAA